MMCLKAPNDRMVPESGGQWEANEDEREEKASPQNCQKKPQFLSVSRIEREIHFYYFVPLFCGIISSVRPRKLMLLGNQTKT